MTERERGRVGHRSILVVVATLGLAAMVGFAGCTGAPGPNASSTSPTIGAPTAGATPAGPTEPAASAATATVIVAAMGTSTGEVPDFCQAASTTYNDYPNRYSFSITVTAPDGADATDQYAPALLGKVAHLTLEGPPDAGSYDAPIVHGPGGAGLGLIFTGMHCEPDGFSTLGSFSIDGLPLTIQPNGTRLGTLPVQ